jgi:hypothetical protein
LVPEKTINNSGSPKLRLGCFVVSDDMGKWFARNIDWRGRLARAVWGLLLIGLAIALFSRSRWAFGLLLASGIFALFEAFRGWCVMRACGIKTKL